MIDRQQSWWTFGLVLAAGMAIGGLTSFGQTWLPFELSPLANSSGSWVALAFGLCLSNRSPRRGVVLGVLALASMLAGYVIVADLRGFPSATSTVLFWTVAAVIAGPVLGIGAAWAHGTDDRKLGLAYSPLVGVLLGEGIYGLRALADTTPTAYWVSQIAVSLGLALVIGVVKLSTARSVAYMVGGSAIVAAVMTMAIALVS